MEIRILLAGLAVAGLIACSDDSDGTATATSTSQATATLTEGSMPGSGIEALDAAIAAALGGSSDGLIAEVAFKTVGCTESAAGPIPTSPRCNAGEPAGTPVEAVLVGGGQANYQRVDGSPRLSESLTTWLGVSRDLYAVKRPSSPREPSGARYAVVFATTLPQCASCKAGNTLFLTEDGIVEVMFDPSNNPSAVAEGIAGTYLVGPR